MESDLLTSLTALLVPFLPHLLGKMSDEAFKAVAKGIGVATWEKAQTIWDRLRPKIDAKSEADASLQEAAQMIMKDPEDRFVAGQVRSSLRSLLASDPHLRQEIAVLLQDAEKVTNGGRAFDIKAQMGKYITNIGTVSGQMHIGDGTDR